MSALESVARAVKRAALGIANLLPEAPSTEAPPPDIDGRHQSEWDPETLRRFERTRKNGKGGNR